MCSTRVSSESRKFGGAPLLRRSSTFCLSVRLFRWAFRSSFPIFGVSFRSRCHFGRKTAKFVVKLSQQLLKREDLFSCSTWSRDCDNNRLHGREKKENYIKLKIDLPIEFLNKFFLSICNTPIQNNFLILCFTSINCILFLFGKSRNRSSSKFITFSNKQPKENGAIWLAIILLSLNNGKSWKCFNSRLPNTTFGFSSLR